ncbi:MAG: SCO family protein [Acidimicrobiia bacterium]|nr:SCO family protein [Acidimicrobiia bacterium]
MSSFPRSLVIFALVLGTVLGACEGAVIPAVGQLEGVVLQTPTPKAAFSLTDTSGRLYDFSLETDGRLTFLYFGYSNCPDICPVHLAQLAEVFDQLPDVRRNSTVVFVTVDPERDTPEAIRAFLDAFSSDFVGLTGSPEELEAAQRAAGVPPAVKEGDGEKYTMGHAGQVLVYTPDGFGYSVYPFGTRQSDWIHDLPILLERLES